MALRKIEREEYVSILSSDATLRLTVPEGTEGAIVRDYETSDGQKGSKTELVFNEISGKITNVKFVDGKYGKLLQIALTDKDGTQLLSLESGNAFGEDFMKKFPTLDLSKEVVIKPYGFTDEKGKDRKGVTIFQDDVKIDNYFYDTETKEFQNGYPEPEGDTKKYDKDDWKTYFIKARKFLVASTQEVWAKHAPETVVDLEPTVEPEEDLDAVVDELLSK